MSCTCKTNNLNCDGCACCTPEGVVGLPDCNPKDPCSEKIDLCCVAYSGEAQPCSHITHQEPLCDLLLNVLNVEFPKEECCALELSIDLLAEASIVTTTTTSTTTSTTSTTSTTTSTTSTTSSTTTTTVKPQGLKEVSLCPGDSCLFACSCELPLIYYTSSASSSILQNSVIYTDDLGTTYAPSGYYGDGTNCYHISGNLGIVDTVTPCVGTGRIEITVSSSIITDKITNITYNSIPVVLTSGTFPIVAGAFASGIITNPGALGTLHIYQAVNTSAGTESNIIKTFITDSNGSVICQNPTNGIVNYEVFNVDAGTTGTVILDIDPIGGLC